MAPRYTAAQAAFVKDRYAAMTNAELREAYEAEFGEPLAAERLKNFASRHRLRKDPEVARRAARISRGGMTDEQLELIRDFSPGHGWRECADEFERRFGWRPSKNQVQNTRYKLGIHVGCNPGGFKPGNVPATKGKTWDDYMSPEGQRRIREHGHLFRKGECDEATEARRRKLLDTYVDPTNGTVLIYVNPRDARYPAERWISYAKYLWMQANGREWPEGHRVVFCDHDRSNITAENVMPVPHGLAAIVTSGCHGFALPYHDRASLELAVAHARLIRARKRAQVTLKEHEKYRRKASR